MADKDRTAQPPHQDHVGGFAERAEELDASVQDLLDQLDLTRTDEAHERMLDAIMGVCRAADALRAFARQDIGAAIDATASMGYYARRAMGEHAA